MKIICVSGKIGTGKTTFCKKLIHTLHTIKFHKNYIQYINIDDFVKSIHQKQNINTQKLQKILFYSGSHSNFYTKKTWFLLNKKFKKLITSYIIEILYSAYMNKKYTASQHKKLIIFDIALRTYCTEAIQTLSLLYNISFSIQYIHIDNNNLYTKLFLLKKHRNFRFQKTLKILQQQVTHHKNYEHISCTNIGK